MQKNRLFTFLLIAILLTLTAIFISVSYIGCNGGDKVPAGVVAQDSVETEIETPDTLVGYVGDGTSMHNLEFLPLEGDTMELELSDDVNRRAELVVGRMIAIAVRWNDNAEMEVVATMDTSEVHELPYKDYPDVYQ